MAAPTRSGIFKDLNQKQTKRNRGKIVLNPAHDIQAPLRVEIEEVMIQAIRPSYRTASERNAARRTASERNAARRAAVQEYLRANFPGNLIFAEQILLDLPGYSEWERA